MSQNVLLRDAIRRSLRRRSWVCRIRRECWDGRHGALLSLSRGSATGCVLAAICRKGAITERIPGVGSKDSP